MGVGLLTLISFRIKTNKVIICTERRILKNQIFEKTSSDTNSVYAKPPTPTIPQQQDRSSIVEVQQLKQQLKSSEMTIHELKTMVEKLAIENTQLKTRIDSQVINDTQL